MVTIGRVLLSGTALLVGVAHCSVLVDSAHSELRCEEEGTIGAPACDPGQVCGAGRCVACVAVDVCGDGVDNDCDGRVDQRCDGGGGGGGGGAAGEGASGAGGVTGVAGADTEP